MLYFAAPPLSLLTMKRNRIIKEYVVRMSAKVIITENHAFGEIQEHLSITMENGSSYIRRMLILLHSMRNLRMPRIISAQVLPKK